MNGVHVFGSLFGLAVFFGAAYMFLANEQSAGALFAATSKSISGTTRALEGR